MTSSLDPRASPQSQPPGPGWWLGSDGKWRPPAAAGGPPQPQVVAGSTSNGAALAAFTLGIIGVMLGLVPVLAIPAGICGLLALAYGFVGWTGHRSGKGLAITGMVLGLIAFSLSIVGFVIVFNL